MTSPAVPPSLSHDMGPGPGDVLAGKYRLERCLGEGGMGTVYSATHLQLHEGVAVKLLRRAAAENPMYVARFVREARAAVRIKSQHVARVLDVGSLEDGEPFMVMELLNGQDLHKTSAARGPLPAEEAALYIMQACEAVAEAHLYGIIHRDLKPANLFLTHKADGAPIVKVLDFGISKVAGEEDQNLTATSEVLGTPLYMSPEQIRASSTVDARSDLWSLGAILYKLLTGRAAFAASTASASLAMIVADAPPSLRESRPDVPEGLEAVVMRCLEKDASRRFQSANELARALAAFVPGAVREPDRTAPGASYPNPTGGALYPPPSRKPLVLGALAMVAVIAVGGAAITIARSSASADGASGAGTTASAATAKAPLSSAPSSPSGMAVPPAIVTVAPAAASSEVAPSAVPAGLPKGRVPTAPTGARPAPSARATNPGKTNAFDDRL